MKSIKNLMLFLFLKSLAKKNIVSEPMVNELPEKKCIGFATTTSLINNRKKEDIPPFFHEVYDNHKLDRFNNNRNSDMFCIFSFHKNHQDFDYYVAAEKKQDQKNEIHAEITLPKGKYVQVEFLKKNHKAASLVILYLRKIWIKKQGLNERDTPPFILYDERFHTNYQKFGCKGENYLGNPIAVLNIPIAN